MEPPSRLVGFYSPRWFSVVVCSFALMVPGWRVFVDRRAWLLAALGPFGAALVPTTVLVASAALSFSGWA